MKDILFYADNELYAACNDNTLTFICKHILTRTKELITVLPYVTPGPERNIGKASRPSKVKVDKSAEVINDSLNIDLLWFQYL